MSDAAESLDGQLPVAPEPAGRSSEEYESEIKQLRKEAAARRVQNREKDGELEEFRQWKESQKTEIEKISERAALAEKQLQSLQQERLQLKAAREAGLDLDLADRVRGDTEEEMLADAKALAERSSGRHVPPSVINPYAGRRGDPVGPEKSTGSIFREWMESQ